MFHTHPEAELTLPPGLAPFGQRSWNWVELSLQIPYFFLSVNVETEEGAFRRHFIFGHLRDALSLITASRDAFNGLEIGLLSPSGPTWMRYVMRRTFNDEEGQSRPWIRMLKPSRIRIFAVGCG